MAEQSHAGDGGGGGAGSGEPTNWRKEADDRLRRLHSLQFGADVALEGKDPAGAQVLALRLLGFLDSQALPGDGGAAGHEASFVAPIRAAASSSVAAAIRARAGRSDRYKTLPPPPPPKHSHATPRALPHFRPNHALRRLAVFTRVSSIRFGRRMGAIWMDLLSLLFRLCEYIEPLADTVVFT